MAAVGKVEENGNAERLMRTFKEEVVDLSDYRDFTDAQNQIGRFVEDVYMTKRIHSHLGYLAPAEFEAAWRSSLPECVFTAREALQDRCGARKLIVPIYRILQAC